jgi:hypothetical protein
MLSKSGSERHWRWFPQGFDLQALFEGLEKTHQSASDPSYNGGDGCGAPLQVIGKKNEALFFLSITELNTASGIRTFFGSADTAENNEIILQNGTILRDVSCLNHGINNVSF